MNTDQFDESHTYWIRFQELQNRCFAQPEDPSNLRDIVSAMHRLLENIDAETRSRPADAQHLRL